MPIGKTARGSHGLHSIVRSKDTPVDPGRSFIRRDILPDIGYIDVLATTSKAHIPLMDVAISVTATDGTALAMRLTDRNGQIPPIAIPAPEPSAGQTPDTGVRPFTPVNVYARLEGYEQVENENLQIFPGTVTRLVLQMIPLSELPDSWDKLILYNTPPQNL